MQSVHQSTANPAVTLIQTPLHQIRTSVGGRERERESGRNSSASINKTLSEHNLIHQYPQSNSLYLASRQARTGRHRDGKALLCRKSRVTHIQITKHKVNINQHANQNIKRTVPSELRHTLATSAKPRWLLDN